MFDTLLYNLIQMASLAMKICRKGNQVSTSSQNVAACRFKHLYQRNSLIFVLQMPLTNNNHALFINLLVRVLLSRCGECGWLGEWIWTNVVRYKQVTRVGMEYSCSSLRNPYPFGFHINLVRACVGNQRLGYIEIMLHGSAIMVHVSSKPL